MTHANFSVGLLEQQTLQMVFALIMSWTVKVERSVLAVRSDLVSLDQSVHVQVHGGQGRVMCKEYLSKFLVKTMMLSNLSSQVVTLFLNILIGRVELIPITL